MTNVDTLEKPTYEQFCTEWLEELCIDDLSPFQKGLTFATNLVAQWLEVTTDDDDFIICDGSGDGGIDIAYLRRADADPDTIDDESIEGDTWYLVQSKYGTSFTGSDAIVNEGNKVIKTLLGQTPRLSTISQQVVDKLSQFQQQASDADRIVLVFATTDPIAQQDRDALEKVKIIGREQVMPGFDVEELSLMTIWEALDVERPRLTVPVVGHFVEQSSGLLVGTVSLFDLFDFLKSYQSRTGNLDQLYEKNVRQFLGKRRKINERIANTLNANPEKFGLYNNGITIVVSNYSKSPDGITVSVNDPYVVNGCQTTRTIWQVLDSKFNAGGTGQDKTTESWKERVRKGGVVTKIVRSDEAEIGDITRYTNSQNSVRLQDFIALHSDFQKWRDDMGRDYEIYLEIQRGGIASRKAWEKQHPDARVYKDYVNAFDLVKVYGAGWLDVPGVAFGKNPPFLPDDGAVYQRMVSRSSTEPAFGARDLLAAYKVKCAADQIGFGRTAERPSRRQSRFLFYHIVMKMLGEIIRLTPDLHQAEVSPSSLTEAVIKLSDPDSKEQFDILCQAAVVLIDSYMTAGSEDSAHKEVSFTETHNADLNAFLKAEDLGKDSHSPLLVEQLKVHNVAFGRPAIGEGQSAREYVSDALV